MKKAAFIIGLFLVTSTLFIVGLLRSSLPQTTGEITLIGPTDAITITRDDKGIPHIRAKNAKDLLFATGFVHAQDRLWQMDMNRHIGHGKLSEIVGPDGLKIDRVLRVYGFTHHAQSAFENLPTATQNALKAYTRGVNAFINNNKDALPPEFLLTGHKLHPWTPVDTLVWHKLMWLDLSGNMRKEIARARLLAKLSPEQVTNLYPIHPGQNENDLPNLSEIYASLELDQIAEMVGPPRADALGSNNWVISGNHTKTGKPLLANDPHLGLTTPSIWYFVHLYNEETDSNLVGVTFPGAPGIVLGRNDQVAWGFTNTAPDSQDLFIEKLTSDTEYLTPEGPKPFKLRKEIIKIKGAKDETLTVRETRHGPVISDVLNSAKAATPDGYVLALQWTALMNKDTGLQALMGLEKVHSFDEFRNTTKHYMGPEQNMVFADAEGNIGYTAPGLVPIRHAANRINGRLPSPGWDARYDWQGFIPYEGLPLHFNPDGGKIATANERIIDDSYNYFITRDWSLPYRGNRIRHLLNADEKHDLNSFKAIQTDLVSDMARSLLPALIASLESSNKALPKGLLDTLTNWDGETKVDRPEPLIFWSWFQHYYARLTHDEVSPELADITWPPKPRLVSSSLVWSLAPETLDYGQAYYDLPLLDKDQTLAWCDDITTPNVSENCVTLSQDAMTDSLNSLTEKYGNDWQNWRWGDAHIVTQQHRPFSQVPAISDYFQIKDAQAGDRYTVNVAGVKDLPNTPLTSTHGASYRGIFDLSDLDKSLYAHPTGQSGHFLSAHYRDLYPLWKDGEYFTIPTKQPQAGETLTLYPANEKE